MKPIPIGNDLNVSWAINRMGEGVPLSAYKLDLYMECGYARMPITEYTVDGNTVKFPFWGKDQKKTGVYKLVAVGNGGEKGMFTATCCGAFQLSSGCEVSCQSDLQVPAEVSCQSDLQVPAEVSCQSDLQVPANGLSAYQVWLSNGHQGTEEDFLAWLQQPAQSAAEEAGKATEAANTAASKADTAAQSAQEAADTANKATEELQGAAGEATDAANEANTAADAANKATLLAIEAAKQADAATDEAVEAAGNADKATENAAAATKSATDAAQAADTIAKEVAANNEQWTQAEQARETAETKRQTDTAQAIADANTARDSANTAAGKAETAASEASTAAEKANDAATLAEQAKELLFRDMWNTACRTYGKYNEETGFYELNGLADITYEQALVIYEYANEAAKSAFAGVGKRGRTNIPSQEGSASPYLEFEMNMSYSDNSSLEIVKFTHTFGKVFMSLRNCKNLREVQGQFNYIKAYNNSDNRYYPFYNLPALEEVRYYGINNTCRFACQSPKLSLASMQYAVEHASNAAAITITVHPEVYAKLTDPANADWHAVNTAAQAKQIAFATTETAQSARMAANALQQVRMEGGELLAPAGCYLTQAEETPIEERLFLTRKVILPGEDVTKWRVATTEEKQEQDDYFERQLPN